MESFGDLDISEEGIPLPAQFQRAEATHAKIDTSDVSQEELGDAIKDFQGCQASIEKLSLFSRNEDKDDVSTGDLKYLLVSFLLGEVFLNAHSIDRKVALTAAQSEFKRFLSICEDLDLLSELTIRQYHREGPPDPNTKRTEKIMRFKRDKEIRTKLEGFEEKRRKAGVSNDETQQEDSDFSEEEREFWLLRIEAAGSKSMEHLEMMEQEFQLLALRPPPGQEAPGPSPEVLAQRKVITDELISASRNLGTDRDRIASNVFKPTHILPTMTVEEFGALECKQAMDLKAEKEAVERAAYEVSGADYWSKKSSNDEEEDEAALYKTRAWDDWKDDHQKGGGNRSTRPIH
mmetsp:Transcript_16586/g.19955  ORF Transcript_16586/g.19955 Transcript_16586/m.19955 type:complete len:347 (-) Transcript_16586:609-1649(-)|eukprot:CAMPEP_0197865292 /NCGR_PEP_ID=MMETSP1438-20131217/43582_1 /TAXON_ID=1461541 /ORGANISM="Pterosperma sp., Strain CCMP1384" /LENGTH=346 /DNA_ID=CAMNT_0043483737 /DNA_START=68 /DNA_END=1108 /DNA_ORIENTATION=+